MLKTYQASCQIGICKWMSVFLDSGACSQTSAHKTSQIAYTRLLIACAMIMAATPTIAASDPMAITNVRVYQSPSEPPLDNATILIQNKKIVAVGSAKNIVIPKNFSVKRMPGRIVVAGYWNSHIHLTTPAFLNQTQTSNEVLNAELTRTFTRWGFTTVFDLASTTAIAQGVRQRIESGQVKGPRILSVGEPFYPTGATPIYARPFYEAFKLPNAEIRDIPSALARVRTQAGLGTNGIKLFTGSIVGGKDDVEYMPLVAISSLSKEADRHGLPVFAHATDGKGLELAIAGRVNIIAHAAPLTGKWTDSFARRLARNRIALIPTLSLFEQFPDPSTPTEVAVQQASALHKAGGSILFGTDAGFSDVFDTRAELRLLNSAIGWKAVLASLTTTPAKIFREEGQRGMIMKGFIADLVILGGDPADRVENLADVRLVMRAGEVIFEHSSAPSVTGFHEHGLGSDVFQTVALEHLGNHHTHVLQRSSSQNVKLH